MANLVIDVGNSYTKVAVFDNHELVYANQHEVFDTEMLTGYLDKYTIEKAIISTVKNTSEDWQDRLKQKKALQKFNPAEYEGINNKYLTPQTLGADRLAAVIGANCLYPGKSNLVIDAGTCVTYDLIDNDANYFGGSISPGLNMRYNALNYYTGGLPLIKSDAGFINNYGNSTTTAIQSGVQNGLKY